jgi:drug/metabolite transporter (DMT)-like permease
LFPTERRRGVALSLCGALCSAIYLFPYKQAAGGAPTEILIFALLLMAALLSLAFALWEGRRRGAAEPPNYSRALSWRIACVLAVATISGNFCGAQAVARLDPAVNSVLLRTEVVFVGVLGALLLGEAVTPALALGASTALVGLAVMHWPLTLSSVAGAAWCLGASASFGLMQVLTRRVITRISPRRVNALRLWLAVAVLACVPHTLERAFSLGGRFWLFVSTAALFGPFAGRLLIMYSLRGLRAAESALLLLLAPVFAFCIGYVGWGNAPSSRQLLGSAIMLLGIALPLLRARAISSRT